MNCPHQLDYTYNTMGARLFTQYPTFSHLINCDFPGSKVFRLMQESENINKRVDDYLYDVTKHKAWLTDYNFRSVGIFYCSHWSIFKFFLFASIDII